jgi:hypothetical protein
MGDATISIIFNLIYLIFWIAAFKKLKRKSGHNSLNLAPQYSFSHVISQWRTYVFRLNDQKWI